MLNPFSIATALIYLPSIAAKQLNIHTKILNPSNTTISSTNRQITSKLSSPSDQKINFQTTHDAHATLYLTTFLDESIGELIGAANTAIQGAYAEFCHEGEGMSVGETKNAQGSYGMLEVVNTPCLQALSDAVVNATSPFLDPSAKTYIPSWVYSLPDDERDQKIALIHQYGSPNVFEGFEPHVTLVGDSVSSEEMNAVFDATPFDPLTSTIGEVGFGSVGEFGTVLKGQDVASPVVLVGEKAGQTEVN